MFKSFSMVTKILGGLTIASAAATTMSVIKDKKAFDSIQPIGEISDVVPETTDDAADQILNSSEV